MLEVHDQMLTNTPTQAHDRPPQAEPADIRDRIQTILGPDRDKLAGSLTGETARETWQRHLDEKYGDERLKLSSCALGYRTDSAAL